MESQRSILTVLIIHDLNIFFIKSTCNEYCKCNKRAQWLITAPQGIDCANRYVALNRYLLLKSPFTPTFNGQYCNSSWKTCLKVWYKNGDSYFSTFFPISMFHSMSNGIFGFSPYFGKYKNVIKLTRSIKDTFYKI